MKALITGASSGIGREIAIYLSKLGYDLILVARNKEKLEDISKRLNIETKSIDISKIKYYNYSKIVREYNIFSRVNPNQKREIIKALKQNGHTVAFIGDGVNDVLALKDADCSIAMASGAQAATQVAQMVLLDSDFSRMPEVVREGRRVVNNLERSGSLFLVKNIFSLTMATISIILAIRYPLTPNQISLVTMWTIGVPSFLLAQMPNHDLIKGRFIDNIMRPAAIGAMADVLIVGLVMIFGKQIGLDDLQLGTCCAAGMATIGMIYMWQIAKPLDVWRKMVIWGCLIGLVLSAVLLPNLWNLVAPW